MLDHDGVFYAFVSLIIFFESQYYLTLSVVSRFMENLGKKSTGKQLNGFSYTS